MTAETPSADTSSIPTPRTRRADLSRKNIENIYPLSPIQQGMLFHAVLAGEATGEDGRSAPGSPARRGSYVVQVGWTLDGALDVVALQRAWQAVADRYAVLRTAFVWERPEGPIQIVWKRVPIKIEQVDLPQLVKHLLALGVSKELLPERLIVLDELPRSSGAKVAKGQLREDIRIRMEADDERS